MNTTHPSPFRIEKQSGSHFKNAMSLIVTVAASVILAILLNMFVFQSYYVDGESMSPTLHTDNRLVISKVERTFAEATAQQYVPERGQIVVINGDVSPDTQYEAPELIKRVIAIPGDTLKIRNGVVTITNDKDGEFNIDQALGLNLDPTYSQEDVTIYVPAGKVFVLGDNRTKGGSLDSRVFGLVDTSMIDGRLWARIMPFTQGRVF